MLRRLLPALRAMRESESRPRLAVAPPPAAADGDRPGRLGDYEILREVGRGGMGVVYEAVQVSLGRRVALKVLPFAAMLDPHRLQRFQNEARAAACLHHGNIVPIFGVRLRPRRPLPASAVSSRAGTSPSSSRTLAARPACRPARR